jgi:hypothetical protein
MKRQTYSISLGADPDASMRWNALLRLANELGTDRSGLIQRIADGDLIVVPRHDAGALADRLDELTREIVGEMEATLDRLRKSAEPE